MKKIRFLVYAVFVFLLSINGVSAAKRLTCRYHGNAGNRVNSIYVISLTIQGNVYSDIKITREDTYIQENPVRKVIVDLTDTYKDNIFSISDMDSCPESISISSTAISEGGSSKLVVSGYTGDDKEPIYDITDEDLGMSFCFDYRKEENCLGNPYYSCVWNNVVIDGKTYNYCNTDALRYVQCGDAYDIPYQAPQVISFIVNLFKIATPIILIIVSIVALLKAISKSNEDEIKKTQKGLIKKVTAAAMVFFVVSIVQFVIIKVADGETEIASLNSCLNCFLNNKCENSIYYKTNVFGEYKCRYINDPDNPFDCN